MTARPWWLPRDWAGKLLWTGLFVSVASFALVYAWVHPLEDAVPATVSRVEAVPPGVVATFYDHPDRAQYPFVKQSIERARKQDGVADTLIPGRAWEGWLAHVERTQPGADPRLVEYDGALWRFELADR